MNKYLRESVPYYKWMLRISVPTMIQNGVTNFVSMLDNIMVGQVGTLEMTGVSIVNQLLFVFNLCIFGAMSGAGIFTAQFYGKKDNNGVKNTVQFKLVTALLFTAVGIGVFLLLGDSLISSYIQEGADPVEAAAVREYAKSYLGVMLFSTLPFAIAQAYASSLRETKDRIIPLVATLIAVGVNLSLNYTLIFGHFGAPRLGINGAAIATVIARIAECAVLMIWSHTHTKKYPFIRKLFTSTTLTLPQIKKISVIAMPLVINEALWAAGMAFLNQCYSMRGLSVVAAINIVSTLSNVFNVSFIAFGSSIGIILSQLMGAGKKDEARKASMRMVWFAVFTIVFVAAAMSAFSGAFPKIYNTEEYVRTLSTTLILIMAAFMPVQSFLNACYFSLRSGGKTLITFIFDSGFMWGVVIPLAFCLSRFTEIDIVPLYVIIQAVEIIKCIIGYVFLKKGWWLNTVVE